MCRDVVRGQLVRAHVRAPGQVAGQFVDRGVDVQVAVAPRAGTDLPRFPTRPSPLLLAQVAAFPSFNVQEMEAVGRLWEALQARKREGGGGAVVPPMLIFNGELDRIVSGYYPKMFYRSEQRRGREA